MARRLRILAFFLDLLAAGAYVFLVLGGRRYLPTPWLQGHLVNVFAGYAWAYVMQDAAERLMKRSKVAGPARELRRILLGSGLALAGLAAFELGVQYDVTDFAVELPAVLLFAGVNCARVKAVTLQP